MSSATAKNVATIIKSAGEIVGKTRLQKTSVLLELTGVGFGFSFDYHLFGPFSEDLTVTADRAVALGYVSEKQVRAKWGGLYSIYRVEAREASDNPARDQIIDIAKDADSIVLELAATAAFLASEGEADPWGELAARKPEKVTRARLSQAKDLYRRFMQVQVPTPLPAIIDGSVS